LHFGSKRFMKENFLKFIDYLNGDFQTDTEYKKIKYLFLVGDVVTGIGNYPNQEKDLEIVDLEEQFFGLAELLRKIRKDIKIIISPGNHDGVRLMEPQPFLDEKYSWPLYELENVIITPNPCYLNLGEKINFSGFTVLTYHGFSYPYYANNIPSLIQKRAMNCPEEIMKYLLKNRHLAPTHSSTQYLPLEKDGLLIREIPDIFVSAHTHKCGVAYYNNILVVSISCWEEMTPYQEKFGNVPDHCKVPIFNLKTRKLKILDFEDLGKNEEVLEEKNEHSNLL
ncbi:MAG: metallophosphoesterase, partial [Candidatus Pacearchaeota archaeon]|nr:metallophosphoesterase [Candidatus Pacearchaeota archaeon]